MRITIGTTTTERESDASVAAKASQKMNDGTYATSQKLAFKRLEQMVSAVVHGGLSEHAVRQLHDAIELSTQQMDPHPNALVFAAVLVLANMQRKGVPAIEGIRKTAEDNPASPNGIWVPRH